MRAYHISDNDFDGVSALYLSERAFGENVVMVASTTRTIDPMVQEFVENVWDKDTLFIITDLSIDSKELADAIDQKVKEGYQMALIDHHPTAFWLNEYEWATVENVQDGVKTSATSMYADYLEKEHDLYRSPIINDYVELVRKYDTWDWFNVGVVENGKQVPEVRAKRLNNLLYMIGEDSFADMVISKFNQGHGVQGKKFELDKEQEYLLNAEQHRIEEYIKAKKEEMIIVPLTFSGRTYQVSLFSAEQYNSELGNEICRTYEEVDFVAMSNVGRGSISFRASKPDVDVSVVAKLFGGGGHAPAGGCDLNSETAPHFLMPLLGN